MPISPPANVVPELELTATKAGGIGTPKRPARLKRRAGSESALTAIGGFVTTLPLFSAWVVSEGAGKTPLSPPLAP
jgi:hypothetical protein